MATDELSGFARGVAFSAPGSCLARRLPASLDFLERSAVEVKIGIQSVAREIVLETNSSFEEVEQALTTAVSNSAVFVVQDDKGGKVLVPADKIAYLELGGTEPRRIGFGNL